MQKGYSAMSDIVDRLRDYAKDDHERGCSGRYYDCHCGYDGKRDQLIDEAAARIEQLEADQRDTTEEFGRLSHDLGNALLEIERLRAERDEQVRWVKDLADSLIEAEGKIGVKNDRIERLVAALREIMELPGEINHSNYNHDDVVALNNSFGEAFHIASAALEERT